MEYFDSTMFCLIFYFSIHWILKSDIGLVEKKRIFDDFHEYNDDGRSFEPENLTIAAILIFRDTNETFRLFLYPMIRPQK